MPNCNLNRYEQALVDAFIAMIPSIIASNPLINFEHIQVRCAEALLKAASQTKRAHRQWTCDTLDVSYCWLHRKNL